MDITIVQVVYNVTATVGKNNVNKYVYMDTRSENTKQWILCCTLATVIFNTVQLLNLEKRYSQSYHTL